MRKASPKPDASNPGTLTVIGHLDVPQDRVASVTAALPLHIELTRAEPGCLLFEVSFSQAVLGRLIVKEIFENNIAFKAHQTRTKASDWYAVTQGLVRHYTIETALP